MFAYNLILENLNWINILNYYNYIITIDDYKDNVVYG